MKKSNLEKIFVTTIACLTFFIVCSGFIGQHVLHSQITLLGFGSQTPTNAPAPVASLWFNPDSSEIYIKAGTNNTIATNGWRKLNIAGLGDEHGFSSLTVGNITVTNTLTAGSIQQVGFLQFDNGFGIGGFDGDHAVALYNTSPDAYIVFDSSNGNVFSDVGSINWQNPVPYLDGSQNYRAGRQNVSIAVTGTVVFSFNSAMPSTNYVAFMSSEGTIAINYDVGTKTLTNVTFNVLSAFTGYVGTTVRENK